MTQVLRNRRERGPGESHGETTQLPEVMAEGVAFWASRLPGWDVARAVIRGEQAAPEATMSRPPALNVSLKRMELPPIFNNISCSFRRRCSSGAARRSMPSQ